MSYRFSTAASPEIHDCYLTVWEEENMEINWGTKGMRKESCKNIVCFVLFNSE